MSSLVTSAAPVNYNNEKEVRSKNQTYKNKDTKKIKKEMIEHSFNDSDDDSSNLADFKPVQTKLHKHRSEQVADQSVQISNDIPVKSPEAFSQLSSPYTHDYYKQYAYNNANNNTNSETNIANTSINSNTVPQQNYSYPGSYVAPQPSVDSHSELLKKLDNILLLLEEQQEEQTNLITEELILYVFLGVFVIYVLDSFVRVGKYIR